MEIEFVKRNIRELCVDVLTLRSGVYPDPGRPFSLLMQSLLQKSDHSVVRHAESMVITEALTLVSRGETP